MRWSVPPAVTGRVAVVLELAVAVVGVLVGRLVGRHPKISGSMLGLVPPK